MDPHWAAVSEREAKLLVQQAKDVAKEMQGLDLFGQQAKVDYGTSYSPQAYKFSTKVMFEGRAALFTSRKLVSELS